MVETDKALLTTFEAQLLHHEVVQRAIREALALLSTALDKQPARAEAVRAELSLTWVHHCRRESAARQTECATSQRVRAVERLGRYDNHVR
jgi:hypothetical protein